MMSINSSAKSTKQVDEIAEMYDKHKKLISSDRNYYPEDMKSSLVKDMKPASKETLEIDVDSQKSYDPS
jgi:hypothetical protein